MSTRTCAKCPFNSEFDFSVEIHERLRHPVFPRRELFNCLKSYIKKRLCPEWDYEAHLKVDLENHVRRGHDWHRKSFYYECHDDIKTIEKICEKCDLKTYSKFVHLMHDPLRREGEECKGHSNISSAPRNSSCTQHQKGSKEAEVHKMELPGPSNGPPKPLPQKPALGMRGKIVHSQAREIVANVIKFMKDEADNYKLHNEPLIPLTSFRERILAATGVSRKLYSTIAKESEAVASGATSMLVTPTKKKPKKKRYELVEGQLKKDFCLFCKQQHTHLARHFARKHNNEERVQLFLKLSKGSQSRWDIIRQLRNEGNFLYNSQADTKKLILGRRILFENVTKKKRIFCPYCKICIYENYLPRHVRKMHSHEKGVKLSPLANDILKNKVIPLMQQDEIFKVVTSDRLIILYGNYCTTKYTRHQDTMIRQKMTLLGRFFLVVHEMCPEIKHLSDLYSPKYIDVALKAVDKMECLNTKTRPKVSLDAVHLLKLAGTVLEAQYAKQKNAELERETRRFIKLLQINKRHKSNKVGPRRNLATSRSNDKQDEEITYEELATDKNMQIEDQEKVATSPKTLTMMDLKKPIVLLKRLDNASHMCEEIAEQEMQNCDISENVFATPAHIKRRWTTSETSCARRIFAKNLNTLELPSYLECVRSVKIHPELRTRTAQHVYAWLNNQMQAMKKGKLNTKKDCCLFCKQKVTHLARHFQNNHGNEEKVQSFMKLKKGCPSRVDIISKLRNEGNFLHNLQADTEELIVARRKTVENATKDNHIFCPHCKICLSKNSLSRHVRKMHSHQDIQVRSAEPMLGNNFQETDETSVEVDLAEDTTAGEIATSSKAVTVKDFKNPQVREQEIKKFSRNKNKITRTPPVLPSTSFKRAHLKRTWSASETNCARKLFGKNLKSFKLPSYFECELAVGTHPELRTRTTAQLYAWLNNQIRAIKKGLDGVSHRCEENPKQDMQNNNVDENAITTPTEPGKNLQIVPSCPATLFKRAHVKRTWTSPEKRCARKIFAKNLKTLELPSYFDCQLAVENHPELRTRTSEQLYAWLNNQIQALKRGDTDGSRRPWLTREKEVVMKLFGDYLKPGARYPSSEAMTRAIEENPELRSRSVEKIRSFLQHKKSKLLKQ